MKLSAVFVSWFVISAQACCFIVAQDGSNSTTVPVGDVSPDKTSSSVAGTLVGPNISTVPIGMKTYATGLRVTKDGNNLCGASLITPTHLLAGPTCVYNDVRWASIGSHYSNGTQDGEQIKIVAILNHPESTSTNYTHSFAIMKLEKPSSIKPVALAAADDSDINDGEWAAKMGWDDTGGPKTRAYELKRVEVQLMSNDECSKETTIDDSMVCGRGYPNMQSCTGDYGGAVIVERPDGDVLIGVDSWGVDCRKPGFPDIYARVSSAREWIEATINGVCFH